MPIERFHIIDEAECIIYARGVYSQRKVFRRGEGIYAAYGGGFIKLHGGAGDGSRGGTSVPRISWQGIEVEGITFVGISGEPKWDPTTIKKEKKK